MIPKIIHSCLIGRAALTDLEERCVRTWKQVLPDFEVRIWNAANGPIHSQFFRDACEMKPINASNYARYWALHEFGGIYLDNDVEILRPFDLSPGAFLGFQRDDTPIESVNVAVMGSVPGHHFMRQCVSRLDADRWGAYPVWTGPGLVTEELRRRGLEGVNVEQLVGDISVYSKERFYPWRWDEGEDMSRVTERTIAIHRWGKTWVP